MTVVLLDSGPVGLASSPKSGPKVIAFRQWLRNHIAAGGRALLPEIADYEVRRELLRARKALGLAKLDLLVEQLEYLPLTTAAMRQAAEFWAEARQSGIPTAADPALDGDMILAARRRCLTTRQ